jgi:acyl transferase domain-containing protein/thioesterase domain-containing protein/acyl carrier protein
MNSGKIAIIGMAGRFPGARNIRQFWQNLRAGVESIGDRSNQELLAAGVTAEEIADLHYVRRSAILDDVPLFDAAFFGFSPRDASIMDPQHRHFLECSWEALEDAGHPPRLFDGSIGVFAGSGMNTYLIHNLLANRLLLAEAGLFQLKQTGNDKDVLSTRVSYQLDLRGPSINIQTACSTSLVAVHLACQSLLNQECDMALAGGATIEIPHGTGYIYREGEILSRDGHCRPFDASSSGTVFGSGLGIVVLRRLEDALESHDNIRAIILGTAINNDGARKIGYLAPSVEGQAEVVGEALDVAGISPDDISYVETHGTGTIVGDPIEIRGLTQAFRRSTSREGYCAIGSIKSNIGHLDSAAGVAALIKTVLAIENHELPPTLHFRRPNPHIDFDHSPFFVNAGLRSWPSTGIPRRAGVTSLGIGGTNAHVILEEASAAVLPRSPKPCHILIVSAKTAAAADRSFANLIDHLRNHPECDLADVAYTCQLGRQAFSHRRALVIADSPEARANIDSRTKAAASGTAAGAESGVVFMFSGQGSQYVKMGRELYAHATVFRDALDRCAHYLGHHCDVDILSRIFPPDAEKESRAEELSQTWLTQPALFAIEYALAQWWISLGVKPAAMVGHSIGEYVAACLAGVLSLEDALVTVALRGRLIYELPAGAMLAIPLSARQLTLPPSLSLAAVNAPELCVVSGPTEEIAAFEQQLASQKITGRRLRTSHAFHSGMMEPILDRFQLHMRSISLRAPAIPYISNVTGTWIKPEEATDPVYWARHIRSTVLFSPGFVELARNPHQLYLECGPGDVLTSLARQYGEPIPKAFSSLPHPLSATSDLAHSLQTLAQLWIAGIPIEWSRLYSPGSARRISLPTYPFEHQRFWIEPDKTPSASSSDSVVPAQASPLQFYRRQWIHKPLPAAPRKTARWLIFRDPLGIADAIVQRLQQQEHEIILVDAGSSFQRIGKDRFVIRPAVREDYDAILAQIRADGKIPSTILHLWSVISPGTPAQSERTIELSFSSPLFIAQALGSADISGVEIAFVSNSMQPVSDEVVHDPVRALLLGPARVIPRELPGIACRAIDLDLAAGSMEECAAQLLAEMRSEAQDAVVAYRQASRLVETLVPLELTDTAPPAHGLEQNGVYVITGGTGGLGLELAHYLASEFQARLVLISRSALPPESEWQSLLADDSIPDAQKNQIRKLIQIRAAASGLLVAQGDVTGIEAMRKDFALAQSRFGRIDGVFHAAGILDDAPLLLKSAPSAIRVLDPKVRGTLVLEEILRDVPHRFLVLFSSISSLLAPPGQIDYAAANAFLDAFAQGRKGRVLAVNWDAWREVGMATRSSVPHPLIGQRLFDSPHQSIFASSLSTGKHWVLHEHRINATTALMPGTGYLEAVASAFGHNTLMEPVEFRDALFLSPLSVHDGESHDIRILLEPIADAASSTRSTQFSVISTAEDGVEHVTGKISHILHASPHATEPLSSILDRCRVRELSFDHEHRTRQEQHFAFGPRWRCLKHLHIGNNEGLAEIELDFHFLPDLASYRMHPALLDIATGCSLYLIPGYSSTHNVYLPFSYRSLRLYRSLPAHFFSHILPSRDNSLNAPFARFDIVLIDDQNGVIAEIQGFTMRRVESATILGEANRAENSLAFKRLGQMSAPAGIAPRDGVRALARILRSSTPSQIIVSSRPLTLEVVPVVAPPPPPAQLRDTTSVEETLTHWFQELLGVSEVKPDDDFFLLGGHSLVGIRLLAKVRNVYAVDFELARLFQARTVRQLAEAIRSAQQPIAKDLQDCPCIVPIQPEGSHTPLYFVHAVGGEVLFYEPLGRALGSDYPLFAFQSHLTSQDELRDFTIEEQAAIYVKQLKVFQANGPYVLGGHSYGGMVAFEMARQLQALGAAPAQVIVLDTVVSGSRQQVEFSNQLSSLAQNIRNQGARYLWKKAALKREYLWREFVRRADLFAASAYGRFGRKLSSRFYYALMDELHLRAFVSFHPQSYAGAVSLIRAAHRGYNGVMSISERDDSALGWSQLAQGGLSIYNVPADHSNLIFEPQVRDVAACIKLILHQIETTAPHHQPSESESPQGISSALA